MIVLKRDSLKLKFAGADSVGISKVILFSLSDALTLFDITI